MNKTILSTFTAVYLTSELYMHYTTFSTAFTDPKSIILAFLAATALHKFQQIKKNEKNLVKIEKK